ncbi:sugar dehydrogenase complex small subunit [Pseudomonas sp. R5(2019)]|uniref:sugar dehydrogenase complex small subunit n=1 Tax=Pseudomonas sp. R5(2019) TaxID=2697566 RepID=UPI001412095E|nr:sugar dehydrogenase complex small subunit [Pseudomonas sp. R5(2019)]NBA93366.1 hypothetical protein [Pseudomonas sp. R5(2019)]
MKRAVSDEPAQDCAPAVDPARRGLLLGLLSAYTASLIPWAVAQAAPDAERGAFVALSALIAGRQSLDSELAARYYDALGKADPAFPQAVKDVLLLINQRQIAPLQLQPLLDSDYPQLAPVPRKIASAWFLGVVGDKAQARALAYENALNAVFVSDVLQPPSYCYGAYGSWANKPA